MQELYDMLVKLGPGWMAFIFVGSIGGTIAYIFAHRQYIRLINKGHEEQIGLKDETIKMLVEAKEQAVRTLEQAKSDAIKERDVYRDGLHEEKAHHQATLLRLTELESRPDLGKLLVVQNEMLKIMQNMEVKMSEERLAIHEISLKTSRALDGLLRLLSKKGILTDGDSI